MRQDGLPVDKVQNAVWLAATQAKWKGREAKPNEMGNNNIIAWTAQMLEEVVEEPKHEDTDEMKQLKDKSQQQVKDLMGKLRGQMVACWTNMWWRTYNGRGNPQALQKHTKEKKFKLRAWGANCWARIFSWLRKYDFQRGKT